MKVRTVFSLIAVSVCVVAQEGAAPQLTLKIVVDKDSYVLKEKVIVKAELTNLTSETLCFPVPNQQCSTPQTGWVVTTGEAVSTGERERFICHVDGRGTMEDELDSDINKRWIKLPPNAVYVTNATEAQVTLSEVGHWRLSSSYHPPEGSFSAKYKTILQNAAQRAGCRLPESVVAAQSRLINVRPADPDRR
jgi:hypothetical protein